MIRTSLVTSDSIHCFTHICTQISVFSQCVVCSIRGLYYRTGLLRTHCAHRWSLYARPVTLIRYQAHIALFKTTFVLLEDASTALVCQYNASDVVNNNFHRLPRGFRTAELFIEWSFRELCTGERTWFNI